MKVIANDFGHDIEPEPKGLSISFCTTCMNRTHHLKQTLPENIKVLDESEVDYEICLVNWGSKDDLHEWIMSDYKHLIDNGKLKYLKLEKDYFEMAPAKNAAHDLATKEFVCNLDADNFITEDWLDYSLDIIQKDNKAIVRCVKTNGSQGRILVSRQLFKKVNGYDNSFVYYGGDDCDFVRRLIESSGCEIYHFSNCKVIQHKDKLSNYNGHEDRKYHRRERRKAREAKRQLRSLLETPQSNITFSSLWIGELSEQEIACMNSFVKMGYKYKLYAYDNIKNIPENIIVEDANKILPWDKIKHIKIISWISDYFRYMLLYKTNEIWVDTDMYCLKRMPFLNDDYIIGKEKKGRKSERVAVSILRMPSKCNAIIELIDICENKIERNDIKWGNNGILIFDDIIRKNNLFEICKPIKFFYPIHYKEIDKLTKKYNYSHILNDPEIYTVHFWNKLLNKKSVENKSLYSFLLNKYSQ